MFTSIALAVLLTLSTSCVALAEGDHHHEGKHGGMMSDTSGHHHVELVTEDQLITLYVLHDGGELQNVKGAKATAMVLSGGKTEKIALTADGNALKGKGSASLSQGDTVVITLSIPGHKLEQARFKLD